MSSPIPVHFDGLIYAKQPHGGISRVFTNLLEALHARDDVAVVLHLDPRARNVASRLPSVPCVPLPGAPHMKPSRVFRGLNAKLERMALQRHWGRLQSGVFHSTYYSTHPSINVPQILTVQDMIYEQFPEFFGSEKNQVHIYDKVAAARAAAAFVFPSEFSMGEAAEYYDIGSRPVSVVPYALDDVFREVISVEAIRSFRATYAGSETFILHTGSRHRHKNFGFLLCGFALWSGRGKHRLLSVGGGEGTAAELSLVRGLGLEERVTFIPSVGDRDLAVAYRAASAFVFPSLSEGYGFPLLEAMACGVPTVALRAGSLPEVGQDVPIWVEPGNLTQLVAALDEAVSLDSAMSLKSGVWSPEAARCSARSSRVRRGVEIATSRTWNDVADEYAEVYRSALG